MLTSRHGSHAGRGWQGPRPAHQRGLSLVEVLVGVAVGLFVVAAAAMLTSTQLSGNRRLMTETQVQQDMRATADIITRELRRSGGWNLSERQVWVPDPALPFSAKPPTLTTFTPAAGSATVVNYAYDRLAGGIGGAYPQTAFDLSGTTIRTLMASPNVWQTLTDQNTLKVTASTGFTVAARHVSEPTPAAGPQRMPCPKLCPDGTTNCWPSVQVRELTVTIAGEATNDAAVKRTVRSIVRPRNDELIINVAGICPA